MNNEPNNLNESGDPWDASDAYELYKEGRSMMKAGKVEGALECLRRSLAIDRHAKTAELMGECLFLLGRFVDAENMLKQSVNLGREARAPFLLAQVCLALHKEREAREMAAEALRRNPRYDPAIKFLKTIG